jgi:hypothetical protein
VGFGSRDATIRWDALEWASPNGGSLAVVAHLARDLGRSRDGIACDVAQFLAKAANSLSHGDHHNDDDLVESRSPDQK